MNDDVPYAVGAMLAISAMASKLLAIERNLVLRILDSQRQVKNMPQIATSNIYIDPAFPPLPNVSTTLLCRRCISTRRLRVNSERARIGPANSHQGKLPRAS